MVWGGLVRSTAIVAVSFGFLTACVRADFQNKQQSQSPVKHSGEKTVTGKVIYGEDDRLDLYDVTDPSLLALADSTVALMDKNRLQESEGGFTRIRGRNFGSEYNLCPSEPFRDQESAAFCSGFLVSADTVVTAGHCVSSNWDCNSVRFVFGFAYKQAGVAPTEIPSEDVYSCNRVVKSQAHSGGADFAVIKLDRPVLNHAPLRLRTHGEPRTGDELTMIGHPSGLPTKVAGGASIRKLTANGYFVATTDSYGGNSGSAVFNSRTLEVEGILVRGERDFQRTSDGCTSSHVCDEDGCRGEDVTMISEVLAYLQSEGEPSQSR